ncbi:hypothetical protein LO771_19240 [Streptacidiphilus sp. ASG 303]|uniref:hypothetical protein n=1 Tax=Streptacidiphilus sp. ASG 303 TaxID=2896847 RepID=UPI001E44E727|nr:hypothetical protein [Streptacidiphilus sp. ASG 303]MCD0484474.1 hypothetical protein [Streptacidiphilus sp. ASG 303]
MADHAPGPPPEPRGPARPDGPDGPHRPDGPDGPHRPDGPDHPGGPRELDELRHRVEVLEHAGPPPARHHRLRSLSSFLLILAASLLSLLAVVAVWADSIVDDTDRYVATVAPLASDPAVQQAVTNRATAEIVARIDVKGLVDQLAKAAQQKGVPPQAADLITRLSGPITSGLSDLVGNAVHKVVTSSAFATVWTEANRAAHASFDKALSGKGGGAVALTDNQVTVDIGPVIARAKDELVKAGFAPAAKIPVVHTTITVFASKDVGRLRTGIRLLQLAGTWLPVAALLLAACGVLLAADRRRALLGAALGVTAAMLVLGLSLSAFRALYLDRLPPGTSQAAAGAVFDALVRFLRAAVRALGALAAVTALGAWLEGPSRPAVAVRSGCARAVGALRGAAASAGMRTGPVGRFVHRRKRWIGALILAVAAVVLLTWSYPTWGVVLWTAAAVLAALAVREFLDTGP